MAQIYCTKMDIFSSVFIIWLTCKFQHFDTRFLPPIYFTSVRCRLHSILSILNNTLMYHWRTNVHLIISILEMIKFLSPEKWRRIVMIFRDVLYEDWTQFRDNKTFQFSWWANAKSCRNFAQKARITRKINYNRYRGNSIDVHSSQLFFIKFFATRSETSRFAELFQVCSISTLTLHIHYFIINAFLYPSSRCHVEINF